MIAGSILLFLPLFLHLIHVIQWKRGMRTAMETPQDPSEVLPGPALGVVLPVRNEAETLPRLLHDLALQSLPPAEVIIVDDASEDGTLQAVENTGPWPFPVRSMVNPGEGKKAGLSAGITALTTPWAVGVDADTRLGPSALKAIGQHLAEHGDGLDMVLLPLRISSTASGRPDTLLDRLQALDFAAMQGWAVSAVRRGRPAMASGGGWAWRCSAFPHGRLRPEVPSGDDVFSLAALLEDGKGNRVGWVGNPQAMVSAAAMPDLHSLLDQRIRWGAKTTRYPKALKEARRVAWTVFMVHLSGAILIILNPWAALLFWVLKSGVDMVYAHRVGKAFGLLPTSHRKAFCDLVMLALAHPLFIATTLLLMPVRTVRWKGRPAT